VKAKMSLQETLFEFLASGSSGTKYNNMTLRIVEWQPLRVTDITNSHFLELNYLSHELHKNSEIHRDKPTYLDLKEWEFKFEKVPNSSIYFLDIIAADFRFFSVNGRVNTQNPSECLLEEPSIKLLYSKMQAAITFGSEKATPTTKAPTMQPVRRSKRLKQRDIYEDIEIESLMDLQAMSTSDQISFINNGESAKDAFCLEDLLAMDLDLISNHAVDMSESETEDDLSEYAEKEDIGDGLCVQNLTKRSRPSISKDDIPDIKAAILEGIVRWKDFIVRPELIEIIKSRGLLGN